MLLEQPIERGARYIIEVMPSFDRDLAGDQCGTTTVTLFDDLQQIASLCQNRTIGR
jgi:hypothetical protein